MTLVFLTPAHQLIALNLYTLCSCVPCSTKPILPSFTMRLVPRRLSRTTAMSWLQSSSLPPRPRPVLLRLSSVWTLNQSPKVRFLSWLGVAAFCRPLFWKIMQRMANDGHALHIWFCCCSSVWEGINKGTDKMYFRLCTTLLSHTCTKLQLHRLDQLPKMPPRHLMSAWTTLTPPRQSAPPHPQPRPGVESKSVAHAVARPTRARARTSLPNVPRSPVKKRKSVKVRTHPNAFLPSLLFFSFFFVALLPYC